LGTVVIDHHNQDKVAFLVAENSGGFATLRGRIQALMRDLGANDWRLRTIANGPWLSGRAATIIIGDKIVGQCGEIDPQVSEIFELSIPMSGAEFNIKALREVLIDPVH
jgi:phenylalanyl-tRNA synthetase beta chain